jgi:hypothetical protein
MAFIPAPNIIMAEARVLIDGQRCENRFMCNNQGAVTAEALQDVAIEVWNWWELNYANVITTNVRLVEVVTTDLTTITGAQFTYAPDTTTFGIFGGAPMPNEVSLAISLRTGNRGRSARGRYYQVTVGQEGMDGINTVSATYAAAAVAAGTNLITRLSSLAPLTIVSYRSGGVVRPGGPVYFPVTSAVLVDNIVDSQRKRRPGVGT